MSNSNELNKLKITDVKRAFDKAARHYDAYALLQRMIGDNLLENLDLLSLKPKRLIDLGSGTGYCTKALEKRYRDSSILLCDLSTEMLKQSRTHGSRWFSRRAYLCADAATLPIASGTADLIFSNLTFQWCSDLDKLFGECRRVLAPHGVLLFSSLGPDTLRELRQAFSTVSELPHVHDFIDMHDVGDALIRAGFSAPVLETDRITMTYETVRDVMRDLRGIGAVNQNANRQRGLWTRQRFEKVAGHYEQYRVDGLLPATYEVVYAHAFCPGAQTRPQDGSTVSSFPLNELKRRV